MGTIKLIIENIQKLLKGSSTMWRELTRKEKLVVVFIILLTVNIVSFVAYQLGKFYGRIEKLEKDIEKKEKESVEIEKKTQEIEKKFQEIERKLEWVKGYIEGYSDKKLKETIEKIIPSKKTSQEH